MDPFFTIIIPHKNIPKLLSRCLASIHRRSDLQIIIVDDNSSPDQVDFNHFPGKEDPDIEVLFTKKGGGSGYARNVGLEHAKGTWLFFADADDIFYESLSNAFDFLIVSDADLVYFGVNSRDSDTMELNSEAEYQNDICKRWITGDDSYKYHHEVPWGKAIRRSLVENNHIRFDELYCGNDSLFAIKCDYYSKKTIGQPQLIYCWMTRTGSLWHNLDDKWFRVRFVSRIHILQFFNKVGINSPWSIERLEWYLNCIKYKSAIDYIFHYWQYGLVTHNYHIMIKCVIDQLRVWGGNLRNNLMRR